MKIGLFATCVADTMFPEAVRATATILERLGHEVVVPAEQTCCGQMHMNSGYRRDALPLADRFLATYGDLDLDVVVSPSSSCVGAVRDLYLKLLGIEHPLLERTMELSEFLVHRLGVEDVGASYPHRVTYHPTCHSLRVTRTGDAPLRLLRNVSELELVELPDASECCGFGGTFAIKNAETSSAILADKCTAIESTGADVCTAVDGSCLLQIGGGLSRRGDRVRAVHLAEILASRCDRRRRAFRRRRATSCATASCGRTSLTQLARSAQSARGSSRKCPIGRSCATPAARSRPTSWPTWTPICCSSNRR